MKKALSLVAGLALACATLPAVAQESTVTGKVAVEANVARVDDVTGGELGLGYRLSLWRVHLTPYVGAFIHGEDNGRYRKETFRNGQTACRDTTNGRFADTDKCDDTAASVYGKVEASMTAVEFGKGGGLNIGGGVRFSEDKTKPYGAFEVKVSPVFSVRGNVGKDYWAAGLHAAF